MIVTRGQIGYRPICDGGETDAKGSGSWVSNMELVALARGLVSRHGGYYWHGFEPLLAGLDISETLDFNFFFLDFHIIIQIIFHAYSTYNSMHEQIFDAIHGNINSHNSTIIDIMHTQFM